MATNDDYISGVNPYMKGLAFQQTQSLLDQKLDSLAVSSLAKQGRIDPIAAAQQEQDRLQRAMSLYAAPEESRSPINDAIDAFQSSTYQTFRNAKNFAGMGDGVQRSNEQLVAEADEVAGFSPEARESLVGAPQRAVMDSLAKGNYLEAAGKVPGAILGTVADSGGAFVGMAAGAIATAAAGAAAPALGTALGVTAIANKLLKGSKAVDAVMDAADTAENAADVTKKLSVASRAASLGKSGVKAAAQMSIVNADMTERQINTYKENFGVNPKSDEVVGMYAANAITTILNPLMIKSVFLPDFKKEATKEIKGLLANMSSGSNFVNIAKRMVFAKDSAAVKVAIAGSAEGFQEYVQTWAEVINTSIGPEDAGNFLKAVARELGEEGNQLQALGGMYLGAGAGGGIKAVTVAPSLAAGTALDVTKATAKGVGYVAKAASIVTAKKAASSTAKATSSYMSRAKTKETIEADNAKRAVHDQLVLDNDAKISDLKGYESFDSVTNESILERINKVAGSDNLSDPKVFSKVKAAVIASYKSEKAQSKVSLEAVNASNILVSEAKKSYEAMLKAGELVGIKKEDIEKTIELAKATYSTVKDFTLDEIQNLDSSASRGLADAALNLGMKSSVENKRKLEAYANENSPEVIRKIADSVKSAMPKVSKLLMSTADKVEKANKELGEGRESIINVSSISPVLKDVYQNKIIKSNPSAVVLELLADTKNIPDDLETVQYLSKVLDIYEADSSYKNQVKGSISESTVKSIRAKLDKHTKDIENSIVGKVKKATDIKTEPARKFVSDSATKIVTALDNAISKLLSDTPEKENENKNVVDKEVKNPLTEKLYKVKLSAKGASVVEGLQKTDKFIQKQSGVKKSEIVDHMVSELIKKKAVAGFENAFNTKNPQAIVAILVEAAPSLSDPDTVKTLLIGVANALRENTISSNTDTEVESVTEVELELDGTNQVDEDGVVYVEKLVLPDAVVKALKDINLKVCKG